MNNSAVPRNNSVVPDNYIKNINVGVNVLRTPNPSDDDCSFDTPETSVNADAHDDIPRTSCVEFNHSATKLLAVSLNILDALRDILRTQHGDYSVPVYKSTIINESESGRILSTQHFYW